MYKEENYYYYYFKKKIKITTISSLEDEFCL